MFEFIKVWIHQSLNSPKFEFIKVWIHQSLNSSKFEFIKVWIHQSLNSSKLEFIKAWIHQSLNSSKLEFIKALIHKSFNSFKLNFLLWHGSDFIIPSGKIGMRRILGSFWISVQKFYTMLKSLEDSVSLFWCGGISLKGHFVNWKFPRPSSSRCKIFSTQVISYDISSNLWCWKSQILKHFQSFYSEKRHILDPLVIYMTFHQPQSHECHGGYRLTSVELNVWPLKYPDYEMSW